jgi:CRISPR-associated protein Csx1
MKFIYQVGRFDKNYNKDINFIIDDKTYKAKLSSISLKNYFQKQPKLILIYPVSIMYNQSALQNNDEFSQIISEKISNYLENPKEVLKVHPHNKDADDFLVIHSIGEYKLFSNIEKFEGTYDDIVLAILCDMIKRLLEEKNKENEFYIDISSGHNIYVSAMLEALRHFSVFSKLLNWQNKKLIPKTYITFSDPILGSSAKEFKIHIQELRFKVFFSSPVSKNDIDKNKKDRISKKLYENNKERKNKLDEFFEKFIILYSAIKNNTPLVLYHFEYNKHNEIINFIKEIIEEIENKLSNNWRKSPSLSKDDYLKIILSLGFYAGIVEVLENKNIKKYDFEKGVGLDEIKHKAKCIYEIFNLNPLIHILGHEIYNLKEGKDEKGKKLIEKVSEKWEKLDKYLYGEGNSFKERNFIAHAGFERNITEVRKENNQLYFRYDSKFNEEIKSCLKNIFDIRNEDIL